MENALKKIGGRGAAVRRDDGLMVFPDGDEKLDVVRDRADRKTVILAVALRRFQQIAIGYARRHAPDLEAEIIQLVSPGAFKDVISTVKHKRS